MDGFQSTINRSKVVGAGDAGVTGDDWRSRLFEIKNKWAGSKTTVIVLWSCLRADQKQNENFDCAHKDIFNLKMAVDDSWKLENIP